MVGGAGVQGLIKSQLLPSDFDLSSNALILVLKECISKEGRRAAEDLVQWLDLAFKAALYC